MSTQSVTAPPIAKVTHKRQPPLLRIGVPLLLFIITLISTTAVGMRYMHNFGLGLPPLASPDTDVLPYGWVWQNRAAFATGLPFSLTLIAILLAHEFGHYFACRSYKVRSTLPWLLPAPSLSGTFGAVIRLRSRVRSPAALIVIGAAGPIAGFLVAIVSVTVGLLLSTYAAHNVAHVQAPMLMTTIHGILRHSGGPQLPRLQFIVPHPILSASWIGLLITALNLIPAGQLDGGHIVYALSPAAHKVSSRIAIATLLLLGVFSWAGWLLWGIILMLPGMRHPQVPDVGEIKRWHYALIPICAAILFFSATYQPFRGFSLLHLAEVFPTHYHLLKSH